MASRNLITFPNFTAKINNSVDKGATIFGYYVRDPREYGVVEFDEEGSNA